MLTGFLLVLATGTLWAGLAAVIAESSKRNLTIEAILPLSAIMVLVSAGAYAFVKAPLEQVFSLQSAFMFGAGVANYLMLKCVHKAMVSGNGGVIWGVTQSSMVLPFLMGLVFFGEAASPLRLAGVFAVLSSLFLFARSRSEKSSASSNDWLLPAFMAFAFSGVAQCLASLPSYFQLEGMGSLLRMCLTQVGILSAAIIDFSLRRGKGICLGRAAAIAAFVFGMSNLVALCCFYTSLDMLARVGYASVGYPMGQGFSIAIFFVICRVGYRQKSSALAWGALCLLVSGIAIVSADIILA